MNLDLQDSELYEERFHFKEKRSNARFFLFLIALVFLFIGFRYYWTTNYGGVLVDGDSMYSTFEDGEQLLIRYTKNGEGIKRGDVIVVHVENYPDVEEYNRPLPESRRVKYLIKRLIAVEGDTVKWENGALQIKYVGSNDYVTLDEPYAHYYERIKDKYVETAWAKEDYANEFKWEYTVGDGEIFFLGDNRKFSVDSRWQDNTATHLVSHLTNGLYQASDVFGVVPDWAIEGKKILGKIFF